MSNAFAIADVAALFGDPSRAAMLVMLMDGRAHSAGELAACAQITPASASLHLGKLTRAGLIAVDQQGRHRYYRLAGPEVAAALEALGLIATAPHRPKRPLSPRRAALAHARTCYDHLAGELAVNLRALLEAHAVIVDDREHGYRVGASADQFLATHFGLQLDALGATRRALARPCLDWTERRPHLAGALGACLLTRMRSLRWLAHTKEARVLRLTARGRDALGRLGLPAAVLG